jgi:acyl carrier protein
VNELEDLLSSIWADALELGQVGRDDDFFELGGDSLAAAVIAAAVADAFGVELELESFVQAPTVSGMGQLVGQLGAERTSQRPALVAGSAAAPHPASFAQERTWLHCVTPAASSGYVVSGDALIRGPLDIAVLRASLEEVIARHDALRTSFDERPGGLVQIVRPADRVELPVIDLGGVAGADAVATELVAAGAGTAFDLRRGPLLELRLVRLADDEHRLVFVCHHLVCDAWSWKIFFDELAAAYAARVAGRPSGLPARSAVQYGDYAAWERDWLAPGSRQRQEDIEWWRSSLGGEPPRLVLPFTRPVPDASAPASAGTLSWRLDSRIPRQLEALGREVGVTFFMIRLAALAARLALDGVADDLVLGTYVSTRRRSELQGMFGLFVNLATVRLRNPGGLTFRACLTSVRAAVLGLSAHSAIPYAQLQAELSAAGIAPPAIEAIFSVSEHAKPLRAGGLEITPRELIDLAPQAEPPVMPWGFALVADRWVDDDRRLRASFDAARYDPDGVRAFLARLEHLLGAASAEPDRPLRDLRP